jgi:hypothetical protein
MPHEFRWTDLPRIQPQNEGIETAHTAPKEVVATMDFWEEKSR